tara:strand:+ start:549 stop:743 length:195 start_codon:yes stop_codon:yes gene_type:complete
MASAGWKADLSDEAVRAIEHWAREYNAWTDSEPERRELAQKEEIAQRYSAYMTNIRKYGEAVHE